MVPGICANIETGVIVAGMNHGSQRFIWMAEYEHVWDDIVPVWTTWTNFHQLFTRIPS